MTTKTTTIDITPTWRGLLPVLIQVATTASQSEARNAAMKELYRLADIADQIIAKEIK